MPQQAPPQASLTLLLIFFFFFLSNNNNVPPPGFPGSPRDYAAAQVAHLRNSIAVLNSSRWDDFSPRTPATPRGEPVRYLNLTGFRQQDGYVWDRADAFWDSCRDLSRERTLGHEGVLYENVTGIVTGKWTRNTGQLPGEEIHRRYNLSDISPGIDWAFENEAAWSRNVTGSEGKLRLNIDEKEGKEGEVVLEEATGAWKRAREIKATMTIQDESSSGDGWDAMIHGVHWPEEGAMLLTTTSDKFAGLFGLPHLTRNEAQFESSKVLLNRTLEKKIVEMENAFWTEVGNPWPSSLEGPRDAAFPTPHCELVVYVQVHPINLGLQLNKNHADPASMVHDIEQELRFPNGAPISEIPPLRMSTVIYSPDCGFLLQSKGPPAFPSIEGNHLEGRKKEVYVQKVQSWMLIFAVVIFGQLLLLKMQSKEASTPSTIGRVSISTISMMLMADGLLFFCLALLSATSGAIFPSALMTAFAALMSVAIAVRFILAIYNVQEPERRERQRLQTAAQEANRPRATRAPTGATPPPAQAGNTPIIMPSDQDIQAEIDEVANAASAVPRMTLPTTNAPPAIPQGPRPSNFVTMYVRFVIGMTLILFLSLAALSWPLPIRTAYTNILAFTYLSFWLPQIQRNVVRNCRKALLWKFVVGQSALRVLPFAYFYLKRDNILFAEPDWTAFAVLAAWVWVQILVLIAQGVLGPRYGVPRGWTEDAWDYHPVLSEDNVEAGGMPIGLVRVPGPPTADRTGAAGEEEEDGGRKRSHDGMCAVDCAICMQVLEVPVVASGADHGVAGILARRLYMVTPCRHVFHSACLEGWMRFRLQCPICRENLPPL